MEGAGASSSGDGRKQIEGIDGGLHELGWYGTPHASTQQTPEDPKDDDFYGEETEAESSSSYRTARGFGDPEMQRRKRVATYKAYAVEGKAKASVRKAFRWLRIRLSGWR